MRRLRLVVDAGATLVAIAAILLTFNYRTQVGDLRHTLTVRCQERQATYTANLERDRVVVEKWQAEADFYASQVRDVGNLGPQYTHVVDNYRRLLVKTSASVVKGRAAVAAAEARPPNCDEIGNAEGVP